MVEGINIGWLKTETLYDVATKIVENFKKLAKSDLMLSAYST